MKLSENITQAIKDFDGVKRGIEYHNITVAPNTPTSQYESIIKGISSSGAERVLRGKLTDGIGFGDNAGVSKATIYPCGAADGYEPNELIAFSGDKILLAQIINLSMGVVRNMGEATLYKYSVNTKDFKEMRVF